jgi:hypothetical protein
MIWTEADINHVVSMSKNSTLKEICAQKGWGLRALRNALYRRKIVLKERPWSEKEENKLIAFYKNREGEVLNIDEFCNEVNRSRVAVCMKASKLGLTKYGRKRPESFYCSLNMIRQKSVDKNGHPRGMLGKKHTVETKKTIAGKSKEMWENMSEEMRDSFSIRASINGRKQTMNRANASWKAGWRDIGDFRKYYRSAWEANYARYLQWLKEKKQILDWAHEPETFWFEGIKRGCLSYLPDFRVTEINGNVSYHEVKGWMDARSKTTIRRMKKYHPNVRLIVVDAPKYKLLASQISMLIDGWE